MAGVRKVRVFISWSGETSRAIAEELAEWIPQIIQLAEPYFSPRDVDKGSKWNTEISRELEAAKIGLLCLTSDNLQSPWLIYEAGALAKSLDNSRVCPLLFGVSTSDLTGPLAHLQAATFEETEISRVMQMINDQMAPDIQRSEKELETAVQHWWPSLKDKVTDILADGLSKTETSRSQRDMLSEVLNLARSIHMDVGQLTIVKQTLSDRDIKVIINRSEHLAQTWFQFVEWAEVYVNFNSAEWTRLGRLADSLRKLYTNTPLDIYSSDKLKEQMVQMEERILGKAEEAEIPF